MLVNEHCYLKILYALLFFEIALLLSSVDIFLYLKPILTTVVFICFLPSCPPCRAAQVNMRRSAAPSQVLGNAGKKPRFIPPGKCIALCLKNEAKEMDQEIKLKEVN